MSAAVPIAWARRLLAADEILDELAVDSEVVTDSALDGSSSDEAGLVDKMSEQHDAVHAFHHHIPHTAAHGGSSGTGLIWLLIVLHVAFVGYWTWFWWTSRKQRDDKKVKGSVPQKVGCIYDFGVAPMSMSSIQLSSKSAQH
ncbi:hypothetical protein D9Q98_004656 [Chlorella vulgaris]|uniref:Uncharacterized protein n=1 Tax=Chlorella vulgaris TaxID=3077 RepID=A0A9D4TQE3_CHLVU|nr:hypothetical protein D9Q98_004656 [Chlorella vulgaris]